MIESLLIQSEINLFSFIFVIITTFVTKFICYFIIFPTIILYIF